MSEVKPTATPWQLDKYGHLEVSLLNPIKIHSPWIESAWEGDAQADANMELIVRAVNAHEKLLAACKAMMPDWSDEEWDELELYTSSTPDGRGLRNLTHSDKALLQLRAAIALAEPQP
jgi:hypothetical protein